MHWIIERSDPEIILEIDTSIRSLPLSIFPFTRAILQGMDDIVHNMKVSGGDASIPARGITLDADNVGIGLYHTILGDQFTLSVAETVLRGTWELFAEYGFSTVEMDIYLGSQAGWIRIGNLFVERT